MESEPDPLPDGGECALGGGGRGRLARPQLVGEDHAAPVGHARRNGRQLPQRLPLEVGDRVRPAAGQLRGDGQEDAEAALLTKLNLGRRVRSQVRVAT